MFFFFFARILYIVVTIFWESKTETIIKTEYEANQNTEGRGKSSIQSVFITQVISFKIFL